MRYGNFKDKIKSNANKIGYFVQWFVDSESKHRIEANYNKEVKGLTGVEFSFAMSEWLIREDVQDAIKEYMKQKKFLRIVDIYNSMYEKALKGDVQASKFIIDFSKSDFFKDTQDDIDNYLCGINIPGLAGDK